MLKYHVNITGQYIEASQYTSFNNTHCVAVVLAKGKTENISNRHSIVSRPIPGPGF